MCKIILIYNTINKSECQIMVCYFNKFLLFHFFSKKDLIFLFWLVIISKQIQRDTEFDQMESCPSWSKEHDWKSCKRQKRFESSNLLLSANKEHTFVCQKCVLCLSKPQAWYIITRQRVYRQRRLAAFVSHHGVSRAYLFLRDWWYTRLRLDLSTESAAYT